ncbi:MAG: sugar phosphate nucleotidyltransferase [Solirubrobacterales bacterium]
MQALILAGGAGTRLRPLTESVAKPALPLAGRPHIAYVIDWLAGHGVDDVVISCGHAAGAVRDALEGFGGPPIRFVEEPDPRGTAGAIRFARDLLAERFLVLNGDVLCDLDLAALADHHDRAGATATIALHPVADPSAYGLVRRRDDGEITAFLEKPDPAETDTDEINAGAYLLERAVLDEIPPGREVSIEREVFPRMIGRGLHGVRLDGYWIDIGTPDRFLQANWDILEGRIETALGAEIGPDGVLVADGVEAADAVIEGPALVATGSVLDEGAQVGPRAVLGPGCQVGAGAAIERSVLLERCVVGAAAWVEGAILAGAVEVDQDARIEPGAVIGEGSLVGAST